MARYTNGKREVEARQINATNGEAVAAWAGGSWHKRPALQSGEDGSYVLLAHTEDREEHRHFVGEWIIQNHDGSFSARTHDAFENAYDEVREG